MEREFIIMPEFERNWRDAELDDNDLKELQAYLCRYPKSSPVIPDTGGLRKLRWKHDKGKRSGMRTIM